MAQSKWEQYDIERKLVAILAGVAKKKVGADVFGHRYLTAYQLAIAFAERYPEEYQDIDLPIGGQGTGQRNSLAQYLAGQLAQRIKAGEITQIEGAFVSKNNIAELRFRTAQGQTVVSSLTNAWDVSMFRLSEGNKR